MQPTYFASFLLGKQGDDAPVTLAAVVPYIENWIFNNKNRKVVRPAEFDAFGEHSYALPNETLVQTRFVRSGDAEYLAIRYEHGDKERRRWRTDVVFDTAGGKGNDLRCSVGVHVGNSDGAITPLGDVASRPAIVPTLIKAFAAFEEYPLSTVPMRVCPKDAPLLVDLLTSPKRHVPLVLMTPRNGDGGFPIHRGRVAETLAGMAYVAYAESAEVTYAVKDAIGNDLNAYNGAVRLYWPGFKTSDKPYRHPLWVGGLAEEIEAGPGGFSQFLLRNLAHLSTTRVLPGVTRWEDVQRRKLFADAQAAHGESDLRVLLDLYVKQATEQKEALDELQQRLKMVQIEVDEKSRELEDKSRECEQWRHLWVESSKSQTTPELVVADEIADVGQALEKAAQLYADQLVIHGPALRKEALHFQKPDMVMKAMRWLAIDYRRSKLGEVLCPDFNISCRTVVGMFYRAHQSKGTMGRFEDDYKVVRNGKANWLREHIGLGTGTEPQSNIRIAFYFDADEKKVVVGFVGQHQQTTASN